MVAKPLGCCRYDEPSTYEQGVSGPISSTANSVQDGRFWWLNNTWNWLEYGALNRNSGEPTTTSGQFNTPVATPNGTTRHIDVSSVDFYWFSAAGQDPFGQANHLLDVEGRPTKCIVAVSMAT